ncbi:MAG TPA: UDP-N-acetylmuramoyl-L-alanine--D-glutamate ligase [Candidatus Absconditabacterales bacterium]|nr:UDP-N-acetylmuramoyl-L-alanine--D-glutamate ligase [Candidatus Absconditabacterales bacterium]
MSRKFSQKKIRQLDFLKFFSTIGVVYFLQKNQMIVVYGKGKVGQGLSNFLTYLQKEFLMMDDTDRDDQKLAEAEKIIPSPGVPPTHFIYQIYPEKIQSELNFIGEIRPVFPFSSSIETIGITGTDGKSTTSWVLYNLFTKLLPDYQVHLSGNFDIPFSQTLVDIAKSGSTKKNLIVIELSSFMLYQVKNFWFDYSVFLNFSPDHLNRHPHLEDYFATKENILKYTKKQARTNPEIRSKLSSDLQQKTKQYTSEFDLSKTNFIGKHNQKNISFCCECVNQYISDHSELKLFSLDEKSLIWSTIWPLPHRTQLIKTLDEIKFYDDSKSTSSHSLSAALEGFSEKIVLIAGGSDKGETFEHLSQIFKGHVAYGVFIGTTAPQFSAIFQNNQIASDQVDSMEKAVQFAYAYAKKNHIKVILLSPGCASFDMFKDYADRADHFQKAIENITVQ